MTKRFLDELYKTHTEHCGRVNCACFNGRLVSLLSSVTSFDPNRFNQPQQHSVHSFAFVQMIAQAAINRQGYKIFLYTLPAGLLILLWWKSPVPPTHLIGDIFQLTNQEEIRYSLEIDIHLVESATFHRNSASKQLLGSARGIAMLPAFSLPCKVL